MGKADDSSSSFRPPSGSEAFPATPGPLASILQRHKASQKSVIPPPPDTECPACGSPETRASRCFPGLRSATSARIADWNSTCSITAAEDRPRRSRPTKSEAGDDQTVGAQSPPPSPNGPPIQRFTHGATCPVCGGWENAPRHQGTRCSWLHLRQLDPMGRGGSFCPCRFNATSDTSLASVEGQVPLAALSTTRTL